MSQYRDLVILSLADENDQLAARVVELTAERDTYREMAQRLIAALADSNAACDRQNERIAGLVDELRRYVRSAVHEAAA